MVFTKTTPVATEDQALAGQNNTVVMTPLRVAQAISQSSGAGVASIAGFTGAISLSDLQTMVGTPVSNQVFVFDGDSLTADVAIDHTDWPTQVMKLAQFTGRGLKYNYAVTGQGISDLQARYTSSVYPHRPAASGTQRSMLFIWPGANDYNTATPQVWLTEWENYVATAKTDGFTVVVFTIMQRNGEGWSDWESSRLTMNEGIRTYAATNSLLLVDVDAIFPDPNNLDFFKTDKTHLNPSANILLAGTVNNLMSGQGRALGYAGNILKLDNTFLGKNIFHNSDSSGVEPLRVEQNNAGYVQTWYYNGVKIADIHPLGILEIGQINTTGNVQIGGSLTLSSSLSMVVGDGSVPLVLRQNTGNYSLVFQDSTGAQVGFFNPGGFFGATDGVLCIGTGGSAAIPFFRDGNSSGLYFSAANHVTLSAGGTPVLDATASTTTITNVLKLTEQSLPDTPTDGMLIKDASDHHIKCYDVTSSSWKQLDN